MQKSNYGVMKKILVFVVLAMAMNVPRACAQIPVLEIIQQGIKKVIVAIDLKVQRLQNKTIWLQNAQKTLENEMSKQKLGEISEWVERQRKLYEDYFNELWNVKTALSYYYRVREIMDRQVGLVKEYQAAWKLFQQDKNFTPEELEAMQKVYSGMMESCSKNIDQLFLVVNAFTTQMDDAARLGIIQSVSDQTEQILTDLKEFNSQNRMISIQRAYERGEIERVKKLYGL